MDVKQINEYPTKQHGIAALHDIAVMLKEVAFQLAVLNEEILQLRGAVQVRS
jgi:hypothetical protein